MRRRQRHHELATAGGYAVPSLAEPRGLPGNLLGQPARAPNPPIAEQMLPGEYHTADGKRPCPNCKKRFRAGAMHFHLKNCSSSAD